MIKSFSFKNESDQFFSFAIYLCFFRVLLDSPSFAALANRWCRYSRIVCCRVGDCDDCCMLRYRSDEGLR